MLRTALYPGSFDPPTNGHVDIAKAALSLCDRLVIAVGVHASKTPLLPASDRVALLEDVLRPLISGANIQLEVRTFDALVVDCAREVGASVLIRGLRDGADLDYEMRMAGMNGTMAPALQTVFLPASPACRHITATLVRQIASMGGDIAPFVPAAVAAHLAARTAR